jgi:hypothetical protein
MPDIIIKLSQGDQSWYLEWSKISDAASSYGMTLEEFKEFYRDEYGRSSMEELERRLVRVEQIGTSSRMHSSAEDVISYNRAGQEETCLTKEQIIGYYCTRELTEQPMGTPHNYDD